MGRKEQKLGKDEAGDSKRIPGSFQGAQVWRPEKAHSRLASKWTGRTWRQVRLCLIRCQSRQDMRRVGGREEKEVKNKKS